jgi:HAD superfamily hydrolase (TIGR01509 family)
MLDTAANTSLVIFDCDGVLVDSELIESRVLAEELTALGFPITADECQDRFTGLSMTSVIESIEGQWERSLPADFSGRVRARDLAVFATELQAVPGIAAALDAIPLARCVASSGSPEKVRYALTLTGLLDHFEPHLYTAHMVERGKPAPDLFLLAAERMGVPPAACTVVEDSVAGIEAARAAGMRVLGFAGAGHAGPGYADLLRQARPGTVFADMAELPGLLGF